MKSKKENYNRIFCMKQNNPFITKTPSLQWTKFLMVTNLSTLRETKPRKQPEKFVQNSEKQ